MDIEAGVRPDNWWELEIYDQAGRKLEMVIACNIQTGEVIRALGRTPWPLPFGILRAFVPLARLKTWSFETFVNTFATIHEFRPAPLIVKTVERKRPGCYL
jgi:hypothetical protein